MPPPSRMTPDLLAQIQSRLSGFPGWRLEHLDRVDSTQDSLREALERGETEHLALSAGIQTRGRGRHGRSWDQEAEEDLAVSVLLRPSGRYPDLLLPFLLPAALYRVLRSMGVPPSEPRPQEGSPGGGLRIKWPNDLLLREKKIAGVLIEGDGSGAYLCGIGCNVARRSFPEDLRGKASSLRLEGLDGVGYPMLLMDFLLELAARVSEAEEGNWDAILDSYAEGFGLQGEKVILSTSGGRFEGRLAGLGPRGIQLENGPTFALGEVLAIQRAFNASKEP